MTRKLKPIETAIEGGIEQDILSLPVVGGDGTLSTIGENISRAAALLENANKALAENGLVSVVAKTLMQQMKRRGHAGIRVRPDGVVVLRVAYQAEDLETIEDSPSKPKLPTLMQLRKEAQERDIDISDLGRQKTLIIKRLGAENSPDLATPPPRLRDEIREAEDPTGKSRLPVRR